MATDMDRFARAIAVERTAGTNGTPDRYRVVCEGERPRKCTERFDVDIPDAMEAFNARLISKGWHDLSPWWRIRIGRAYLSGARNVVIRGGRRGGKSTSVCRIAVHEVLNVPHHVQPGDIGYFAIISAERDQAKERLRTIAKILETLGVAHKALTEEIRIDGSNLAIKCFTASLAGVVSFTCIGALCDEEARWRDRDTGSNPAAEVLASLRPTMATQPLAKIWHVSSPWSTLDVHHKMIERGNQKDQIVFSGATWEMNPTITEADTYLLEPDEATRLREYAAIPMSSDSAKFFSAALIDRAIEGYSGGFATATVAGGDFAFRKDASALAVVEVRDFVRGDGAINPVEVKTRLAVTYDTDRVPTDQPLRVTDTIAELADIAEQCGAETLCTDLHYVESVREVLEQYPIDLVEFPTSSDAINEVFVRVRVLLAQGLLDLSGASAKLIDQLKQVESKPTDGAGLIIRQPRGRGTHGDLVSAMVAAVYSADHPEMAARSTGRRRFVRGPSTAEDRQKWREFAGY
jgi:hypothetical protein